MQLVLQYIGTSCKKKKCGVLVSAGEWIKDLGRTLEKSLQIQASVTVSIF